MQGGGLEEPNMLVPVAALNYPGLHVLLTYLFSHPFYWFCTFSYNQDDFTRSIQPSVGKSGKDLWMPRQGSPIRPCALQGDDTQLVHFSNCS